MTRKKVGGILWGIVWMAVGVAIALSAFGYVEFWPIFRTWWPLLIIIPSLVSFISNGFQGGGLAGLIIGTMLLLYMLDIMSGVMLRKLIIPVILILIGLSMVVRSIFVRSRQERLRFFDENQPEYVAVLSSKIDSVATENFTGAKAEAVFGTETIDLRASKVTRDVAIDANATFGQVNILVPPDVNVKSYPSGGIFGGTSNEVGVKDASLPAITVFSTSIFGGVKIR